MATIGDPLMDLGTSLGYWMDPDDPPGMLALKLSPTTLPGNPSRAEIAQWYAQRKVEKAYITSCFIMFMVCFKIAVIVQQISCAVQTGLYPGFQVCPTGSGGKGMRHHGYAGH